MDNQQSRENNDDRLSAKLAGRYIMEVQTKSQAISSFMGPPIGLYFIFVTANLTLVQSIELIVSLVVFIGLVNFIIPIFVRLASRQARTRLDHIYKGTPIPENADPILAWREILALAGRTAVAQFITSNLLVTLPIGIFMRTIGGASWLQIVIITIGGTLAEMAILIQGVLYMDSRLAPVRRVLLPADPSKQSLRMGFGLAARQYFITGFLLIITQLTAGTLVYVKFLSALAPGANIPAVIAQLQIQLGIIGSAIFILGIFLANRQYRTAVKPILEMTRAIDEVQKGDISQRAEIYTSDETAELTIRLNQTLDHLQASQTELERQISDRTNDLVKKTLYLQAAARVAHEAAEVQDINTLLDRTVELISDRFGFYHTGIFLIDDSGDHAVLQAASSEGGRRMLARGHKLDVGLQGIVGSSAYQNKPRAVMDVDTDKEFYKNPDLPMTRSEVAVPLTARGRVLGVLDIQSTEPSAFQQDDIDVLLTMGDQIGLAIQNAQSLSESQDAVRRMELATAENMQRIWRQRIVSSNHAYRYSSMGLNSAPEPMLNLPAQTEDTNRLAIPIMLRGQRIGTINLQKKKETIWNETDRSLAIEVSNQVGLALENARLLDEAQHRAAQEQSLSQLTAHLSSSLDPEIILQTAVRELYHLPNVEEVSVFVTPQDKETPSSKPAEEK